MTRPRGCRTVICECYTSAPWTAHNRLAYTQMIDGAQRAAVDTLGDALFTIVHGPGQAGTATSPTSSEKLARPGGLKTCGANARDRPFAVPFSSQRQDAENVRAGSVRGRARQIRAAL